MKFYRIIFSIVFVIVASLSWGQKLREEIKYFESGNVKSKSYYDKNEQKSGTWVYYDDYGDEEIIKKETYKNGIEIGPSITYHDDRSIASITTFDFSNGNTLKTVKEFNAYNGIKSFYTIKNGKKEGVEIRYNDYSDSPYFTLESLDSIYSLYSYGDQKLDKNFSRLKEKIEERGYANAIQEVIYHSKTKESPDSSIVYNKDGSRTESIRNVRNKDTLITENLSFRTKETEKIYPISKLALIDSIKKIDKINDLEKWFELLIDSKPILLHKKTINQGYYQTQTNVWQDKDFKEDYDSIASQKIYIKNSFVFHKQEKYFLNNILQYETIENSKGDLITKYYDENNAMKSIDITSQKCHVKSVKIQENETEESRFTSYISNQVISKESKIKIASAQISIVKLEKTFNKKKKETASKIFLAYKKHLIDFDNLETIKEWGKDYEYNSSSECYRFTGKNDTVEINLKKKFVVYTHPWFYQQQTTDIFSRRTSSAYAIGIEIDTIYYTSETLKVKANIRFFDQNKRKFYDFVSIQMTASFESQDWTNLDASVIHETIDFWENEKYLEKSIKVYNGVVVQEKEYFENGEVKFIDENEIHQEFTSNGEIKKQFDRYSFQTTTNAGGLKKFRIDTIGQKVFFEEITPYQEKEIQVDLKSNKIYCYRKSENTKSVRVYDDKGIVADTVYMVNELSQSDKIKTISKIGSNLYSLERFNLYGQKLMDAKISFEDPYIDVNEEDLDKLVKPDLNSYSFFYSDGQLRAKGASIKEEKPFRPKDFQFCEYSNTLIGKQFQDTIENTIKLPLYNSVPSEGMWEFYHRNGKLSAKGYFEEGKQIGIWTYLHSNGNLLSTINYDKIEKDQEFIFYHDNNKIAIKGQIKNGKKEGFWTYYHKNGQKESIENYDLNASGHWEYFYDNGKKRMKIFVNYGVVTGDYTMYYPNGNIQETGTINDYSGKNFYDGNHYLNPNMLAKIGTTTIYHENGQVKEIEKRNSGGKTTSRTIYYVNGKEKEIWDPINDIKQEFDSIGHLTYHKNYGQGFEKFYLNNKITQERLKLNDTIWTCSGYYETGETQYKGTFRDVSSRSVTLKINGLFTSYSKSGNVLRKTDYDLNTVKSDSVWDDNQNLIQVFNKSKDGTEDIIYFKDGTKKFNTLNVKMFENEGVVFGAYVYKNSDHIVEEGGLTFSMDLKEIMTFFELKNSVLVKLDSITEKLLKKRSETFPLYLAFKNGTWKYYNDAGKLTKTELWEEGILVKEE